MSETSESQRMVDNSVKHEGAPLKQEPHVGSRDGAVVRVLTTHQCGPGLIPGLGVISGLNLLLVLVLAPRGFSPGTPVSPSLNKPTFPNSNNTWKMFPVSALRITH